jgi:hypothetical protein
VYVFIVSFSSAFLVLIVGLLIGGLGIGLFAPNNSGWLASVAPAELRGKAMGGMTSALFLGQFFQDIEDEIGFPPGVQALRDAITDEQTRKFVGTWLRAYQDWIVQLNK